MSVGFIGTRLDAALFASGEDPTLLIAARNGSGEAFAGLFERHRQKILGVAMRLTNNREDAEDITQQSFQKAFIHLHEFEGRSSFSTWVARIAFNEGLMLLRSRPRVSTVPIEISDTDGKREAVPPISDERSSPEHSYSQKERQRIVRAALNKLKPGIRKAIELFDLGGRSVRETARILGVSTSAVKSRVHRGRKMLRTLLRSYALQSKINLPHAMSVAKTSPRTTAHREFVKETSDGYPPFVCRLGATKLHVLRSGAAHTAQPSAGSVLRFS